MRIVLQSNSSVALLRPGRFEVQVEVPPPRTLEQRVSILKVHTSNMHAAGRLLVSDPPEGTAAARHLVEVRALWKPNGPKPTTLRLTTIFFSRNQYQAFCRIESCSGMSQMNARDTLEQHLQVSHERQQVMLLKGQSTNFHNKDPPV